MNTNGVREATEWDAQRVSRLFHEYRIFYGIDSKLSDCERFIAERLKERDSTIVVAVNSQNELVGFAQLFPLFSEVSLKRIWLLNDLFVAVSARRQGVAERLMGEARRWVQASGGSEITLATAPSNLAAQALYGKMGYSRNEDFWIYNLSL